MNVIHVDTAKYFERLIKQQEKLIEEQKELLEYLKRTKEIVELINDPILEKK